MENIKFSIIMPAYNAEKYIKEAIESVLKQSYKNWELIIVDDGSVDQTPQIVDEFAEKDSRIVVIHQENSGTASAARNRALEVASGDFSQMLDADDLISDDVLQVYANMLAQNNYDIILPIVEYFKDDGTILWKKGAPNDEYDLVINGEKAFEYSIDWTIHGVFAIRMELLKKIKYDPKLINGDEFTTRKLFYHANQIGFCEEKYFYRNNLQSTTKSIKNEVRMYETLQTYYNIYDFAKRNQMSQKIQKMCIQKLTSAMIYRMGQFIERKHLYSNDEIEKVESNLKNVFALISRNEWKYAKPVYLPIVILGTGNYQSFKKVICITNRFKRMLKGK